MKKKTKSLFINLSLLFLSYLFIEICCFLSYSIYEKSLFSPSKVKIFAKQILEKNSTSIDELIRGKKSALHPYLGYVYNPKGWKTTHAGVSISDWGFIDDKSPIQKKDNKTIIIGILGGSVAWWFQKLGLEKMLEELKDVPLFKNKKIKIVRIALGGAKQPQALMALTYLTALGAEFDIVINIDGYNEVSLPYFYNTSKGINASFPIYWKSLLITLNSFNNSSLIKFSKLNLAKEKKIKMAKTFYLSPLRYSPLASTLFRFYNKFISLKINNLSFSLNKIKNSKNNLPFPLKGAPFLPYKSKNYFYNLASIWKNSSIGIKNICNANSFKYYHFLQPNQYVEGSKPLMTEEEKSKTTNGVKIMIEGVKKGYPLLIKMGEELKKEGVKFYDLTKIFKDTASFTYNDSCCHLTIEGNEILGKAIGERIREDLKNEKSS